MSAMFVVNNRRQDLTPQKPQAMNGFLSFCFCGFCGVKVLPVIGYNTINIPDIFWVFTLI